MDVLLYSKFSNASNQLITQLQKTPILYDSLSLICIDNKEIRQKIINDEKIIVKEVPCYIRLNNDTGSYEIFEGLKAFEFFDSIQEKIRFDQVEHEKELLRQQMQHEILSKQVNENQSQTNVQSISNVTKQTSPEAIPKNKAQSVTFTSIDELFDDDNTLNDISSLKPAKIDTYVHIEKTDNSEFSERMVSSKKAENSLQSSGNTSLLSKALKMQKERDTVSTINHNPNKDL